MHKRHDPSNSNQLLSLSITQGIRDLFSLFTERKQELILWKVKPSVLRIISGAMNDTPFKYCSTEAELETLLDGTF